MATIERDAVSLHVETAGDGPPLLLIAGLASDSASWGPVWAPLAERFGLIAPDNRGCGRTTPQTAPISIEAMAQDALAVLDALGVTRAHVLGHSMGAMIAATLAAAAPERVDRLVLAGAGFAPNPRNALLFADMAALRTAGVAPELWFRLLFPWLFAPAFFADRGGVEEAARLSVAYPYPQSDAAFAAQAQAAAAWAPGDRLASLRAPTLALLGGADLLFAPEAARASLSAVADLSVVVLEGAGHSLHWDAPAAFAGAVSDFLTA
jgi:pimeloyl-ACP methyl ester carboxylesterase